MDISGHGNTMWGVYFLSSVVGSFFCCLLRAENEISALFPGKKENNSLCQKCPYLGTKNGIVGARTKILR